jgi:hypothetical protein
MLPLPFRQPSASPQRARSLVAVSFAPGAGRAWYAALLALSSCLAAASSGGLAGCAPEVEAATPARVLPHYDRRAAELFDDAIEPSAVGYRLESIPSSMRPHLRERTLAADAVVRARAVTLTSNHDEAANSWQVGLRTIETLAGTNPPAAFTLQIRASDPSAGVVRSNEGQIAGKTFVAFLREFSPAPGADGAAAAQLHFHVAPDSKDEVDAVREAALLGEVR